MRPEIYVADIFFYTLICCSVHCMYRFRLVDLHLQLAIENAQKKQSYTVKTILYIIVNRHKAVASPCGCQAHNTTGMSDKQWHRNPTKALTGETQQLIKLLVVIVKSF